MGHDPVPVGIPTFPSLEAMYEKSLEEITALITKSALWLSTVLVVLALTINWWAPFFY